MKTKTIGEILQEERLRHHISIDALAKKTRIRSEYLDELKKNNFEQLPAAPFVKGFIKTYAQIFGFDHAPVMALLRRDYRESAKGTLVPREFLKPLLQPKRQLSAITLMVRIVIVTFVTAAAYIGMQWYRFQQPPSLEITAPQQHDFVGATVTVEGKTNPEAVVSINDSPVVVGSDGLFKTEVSLQTEGTSTISISATDRRGKKSEVQRKVFVRF